MKNFLLITIFIIAFTTMALSNSYQLFDPGVPVWKGIWNIAVSDHDEYIVSGSSGFLLNLHSDMSWDTNDVATLNINEMKYQLFKNHIFTTINLFYDNNQTLWILTYKAIFERKKSMDWAVYDFQDTVDESAYLSGITFDGEDIWLSFNATKLYKIHNDNMTRIFDLRDSNKYDLFHGNFMYFIQSEITVDANRNVWYKNQNRSGVGLYNVEQDSFTVYDSLNSPFSKSQYPPLELFRNINGRINVGTYGGRIYEFDGENWTLKYDLLKSLNLTDQTFYIRSMTYDKKGNLYVTFYNSSTTNLRSMIIKITPDNVFSELELPPEIEEQAGYYDIAGGIRCDSLNRLIVLTLQHGLLFMDLDETGVEDNRVNSQPSDLYLLKVYPNPANNLTTLKFSAHPKLGNKLKARLISTLGAEVKIFENIALEYSSQTSIGFMHLDVGDVPNGYYLLDIYADGESQIIPLAVVR